MSKTLQPSGEKIQLICNAIKHEALLPAEKEAEQKIASAEERADEILKEAEKIKEKMIQDTRLQIEQEKKVFYSSLEQGSRQVLETLRQSIEKKLFYDVLDAEIKAELNNPKVIGQLIEAIVHAINQEGLDTEIGVIISKNVKAESLVSHLGKKTVEMLQGKEVELQSIGAGVKVRLINKKITIDVTDEMLLSLLAGFVRKDFREWMFRR